MDVPGRIGHDDVELAEHGEVEARQIGLDRLWARQLARGLLGAARPGSKASVEKGPRRVPDEGLDVEPLVALELQLRVAEDALDVLLLRLLLLVAAVAAAAGRTPGALGERVVGVAGLPFERLGARVADGTKVHEFALAALVAGVEEAAGAAAAGTDSARESTSERGEGDPPAVAHGRLRVRVLNDFKVDHLAGLCLACPGRCTLVEGQMLAHGLEARIGRLILGEAIAVSHFPLLARLSFFAAHHVKQDPVFGGGPRQEPLRDLSRGHVVCIGHFSIARLDGDDGRS